jgi:hypothetical protein
LHPDPRFNAQNPGEVNLAPPVNSLNRVLFSLFKSFPNIETFEKCSFLFEFKEGENFNHRNTFSISRIKLKLHFVHNLSLTQKLGKKGRFAKVSALCLTTRGGGVQSLPVKKA